MARLLTDHTLREHDEPTFREFMAPGLSSTGLEQLRRDRLHELRAVIESLRRERALTPSDANADPRYCSTNLGSTTPGPQYLGRHS